MPRLRRRGFFYPLADKYRCGSETAEYQCHILAGRLKRDPKTKYKKDTKWSNAASCEVWYLPHEKVTVVAYGDTLCFNTIKNLKRGDEVLVFGTLSRSTYRNKYGEEVLDEHLSPYFIISAKDLFAVSQIVNSPQLQHLFSDRMESAGDYEGMGEVKKYTPQEDDGYNYFF